MVCRVHRAAHAGDVATATSECPNKNAARIGHALGGCDRSEGLREVPTTPGPLGGLALSVGHGACDRAQTYKQGASAISVELSGSVLAASGHWQGACGRGQGSLLLHLKTTPRQLRSTCERDLQIGSIFDAFTTQKSDLACTQQVVVQVLEYIIQVIWAALRTPTHVAQD